MTAAAALVYDDVDFEPSNESYVGKKAKPPNRKLRNAEVVPFPIMKRGNFISNAFVNSADRGGRKYLRRVADRYRDRLENIGVAPDRVQAEMRDLEFMFFGD